MSKEFIPPSFNTLWKDDFYHRPQVPLNWKEAESHKEFAEYIYKRLVDDHYNDLVQEEYNEGFQDGKTEMLDLIQVKFQKLDENEPIKFKDLEEILNEVRKNIDC